MQIFQWASKRRSHWAKQATQYVALYTSGYKYRNTDKQIHNCNAQIRPHATYSTQYTEHNILR